MTSECRGKNTRLKHPVPPVDYVTSSLRRVRRSRRTGSVSACRWNDALEWFEIQETITHTRAHTQARKDEERKKDWKRIPQNTHTRLYSLFLSLIYI